LYACLLFCAFGTLKTVEEELTKAIKYHFNRYDASNYHRLHIRIDPVLHEEIKRTAYSPDRCEAVSAWVEEACREKLERDRKKR